MKQQKLNLHQIKIKSFVTSFEKEEAQTVQGGRKVKFPRETAQPSVCNVSCLPPKSEGCFSEAPGNCTETIRDLF